MAPQAVVAEQAAVQPVRPGVAVQEVVEIRAEQILDVLQGVGPGPAARDTGGEIDGHARGRPFVGRGIDPGAPVEVVVAAFAPQGVVAAAAVQAVVAQAAAQDVGETVAQHRVGGGTAGDVLDVREVLDTLPVDESRRIDRQVDDDPFEVAGVEHGVEVTAAIDEVQPAAAVQQVVAAFAPQGVLAFQAGDRVVAAGAGQGFARLAGTGNDCHGCVLRESGPDGRAVCCRTRSYRGRCAGRRMPGPIRSRARPACPASKLRNAISRPILAAGARRRAHVGEYRSGTLVCP